jgi:hypothetical protein
LLGRNGEPDAANRAGAGTPLTLHTPVYWLENWRGSCACYKLTVPAGLTQLRISTAGNTGDCDLYVKYGAQPTLHYWDYRPYLEGANETVTIANPAAGDWHIMIHGYRAYRDVTLLAR